MPSSCVFSTWITQSNDKIATHNKAHKGSNAESGFCAFCCCSLCCAFSCLVLVLIDVIETDDVLTRHHDASDGEVGDEDRLDAFAELEAARHTNIVGSHRTHVELNRDRDVQHRATNLNLGGDEAKATARSLTFRTTSRDDRNLDFDRLSVRNDQEVSVQQSARQRRDLIVMQHDVLEREVFAFDVDLEDGVETMRSINRVEQRGAVDRKGHRIDTRTVAGDRKTTRSAQTTRRSFSTFSAALGEQSRVCLSFHQLSPCAAGVRVDNAMQASRKYKSIDWNGSLKCLSHVPHTKACDSAGASG